MIRLMRALRLLPCLLLAAAVVAGCGSTHAGQPQSAKSSSSRTSKTTIVYFLRDGGGSPIGVVRTLEGQTLTARGALDALLRGPSDSDRKAGITSAIPSETKVVSFSLVRKATAHEAIIELSGLPDVDKADAVLKARVITQIARTLIGLNDIHAVRVRAANRPWDLWTVDGGIIDAPTTYDRLLDVFWRVCTSKPGTEVEARACFQALP
jgi:spore germination protein GerM